MECKDGWEDTDETKPITDNKEDSTMETRKERIRIAEDDVDRRAEAILVGQDNLAEAIEGLELLKLYTTDRAQAEGEAAIAKANYIKLLHAKNGGTKKQAEAAYEIGILDGTIKI